MTGRPTRILLTNDDGFDAPGLAVLCDVARQLSDEVWIVAPQFDQSGKSSSITIKLPLRCVTRGERAFEVSGTPVDCVGLACQYLMKDAPPDLILSGVNSGWNCGDIGLLSGTLGAAFIGTMLNIPSIAISLKYETRDAVRWDVPRLILPDLLRDLLKTGWSRDACLSINLPGCPVEEIAGIAHTRAARDNLAGFMIERRNDLRDEDYFWLYVDHDGRTGDEGSDLAALSRNEISVATLPVRRAVDA